MPNRTLGVQRIPYDADMPWFMWFALALIITAFAAVTGVKAKGTRHVAGTQLMGVARWVLLLFAIIVAYQAYRVYGLP